MAEKHPADPAPAEATKHLVAKTSALLELCRSTLADSRVVAHLTSIRDRALLAASRDLLRKSSDVLAKSAPPAGPSG